MHGEKVFRNLGTITPKEQKKLIGSSIAIVGLGGTGCIAFESLVRVGVGRFVIFDIDRYDLTNYNRQLYATDETLDQMKIDIAKSRAKSINSNVSVTTFTNFDGSLIKNCNVVVDCTDNVKTRIKISRAARKYRIPYIFCSANFSKGMVSVFTDKKFENIFQINPKKLDEYNTCASVLSFAPNISGLLAASQALNYILKKPFIKAPDILYFDLFKKDPIWIKRL